MAERPGTTRPRWAVPAVAAGTLVVLLLIAVRGPVALLAAACVLLLAAVVVGLVPLLGHDGIDWDWQPGRADDVPPEPGIAATRRLLAPSERDTTADAELQALLRAIADDRLGPHPPAEGRYGHGALATYLAGPPRRLSLAEAERLVADLEALSPTKETP